MGKRSSFERIPRDFYPTPAAAVPPLIPHLGGVHTFAEPCCGDGALVNHLEAHGLRCVYQGDIATGQDALALEHYGDADAIITNPPYQRPLMHALIQHFARILPTWLLLESDWAYTKQAGAFMPCCSDIVSIGRLRWIEGTTMSGKQNFAWYRFDARHLAGRQENLRNRAGPTAADGSVVRAALMFTFVALAAVVFRRASSLNALGGAALALLIWRPQELFDPSLQLTFLSVLAIIVIAWPLLRTLSAIGAWRPTRETPYPPA